MNNSIYLANGSLSHGQSTDPYYKTPYNVNLIYKNVKLPKYNTVNTTHSSDTNAVPDYVNYERQQSLKDTINHRYTQILNEHTSVYPSNYALMLNNKTLDGYARYS